MPPGTIALLQFLMAVILALITLLRALGQG